MPYKLNPFTNRPDYYETGALPPEVPLTFDGNSGSAQAAANVITFNGATTYVNHIEGITVDASGSTVYPTLSNRIAGVVTTSGAVLATVTSMPLLGTAAAYKLYAYVVGRNTANGDVWAASIQSACKTDGATASIVGTDNLIINSEGTVTTATAAFAVSVNDLSLTVTGVAAIDMEWTGVMYNVVAPTVV